MNNGYARVKAAIKGEPCAEVAAYPILGAVSAKLAAKSVKEYLTDPKALVSSHLATYEYLNQDALAVTADLLIEAEAMGSILEFPEDQICHVSSYALSEKKNIDKIKIPDPKMSGRLPYFLSACQEVKKSVTEAPVGGTLVGPWSIAASLRGLQELLMDTFHDLKFVHELMRMTTETAKVCGEALLATGASLSYTDAAASCDVISPKIYREFIKPYHTEIFSYFAAKKAGVTIHICGNALPILGDVVEAGPMAISIDAKVPLAKAVEIVGRRAAIIGNVATGLFNNGTRGQMEEAVVACLEAARGKSRFILSSGCEVPVNASFEKVRWFMESARKHGRSK